MVEREGKLFERKERDANLAPFLFLSLREKREGGARMGWGM